MEDNNAIKGLMDKRTITEQIVRYCRALNRCDKELMMSIFHDDAIYEHGPYQGDFKEFSSYAMSLLEKLDCTHHQVGNILVDLIDSDNALAESYWTAFHNIGVEVDPAPAFPDHEVGVAENIIMGGRYVDHFERRNGEWKITHRYDLYEWASWAAASERGFAEVPASDRGQHKPDDRSYNLSCGTQPYAFLYRGQELKGL